MELNNVLRVLCDIIQKYKNFSVVQNDVFYTATDGICTISSKVSQQKKVLNPIGIGSSDLLLMNILKEIDISKEFYIVVENFSFIINATKIKLFITYGSQDFQNVRSTINRLMDYDLIVTGGYITIVPKGDCLGRFSNESIDLLKDFGIRLNPNECLSGDLNTINISELFKVFNVINGTENYFYKMSIESEEF